MSTSSNENSERLSDASEYTDPELVEQAREGIALLSEKSKWFLQMQLQLNLNKFRTATETW